MEYRSRRGTRTSLNFHREWIGFTDLRLCAWFMLHQASKTTQAILPSDPIFCNLEKWKCGCPYWRSAYISPRHIPEHRVWLLCLCLYIKLHRARSAIWIKCEYHDHHLEEHNVSKIHYSACEIHFTCIYWKSTSIEVTDRTFLRPQVVLQWWLEKSKHLSDH